MPLYTFFPCLRDGNSLSFESHELPDDRAAEAFALVVIERHRSCTHVVAWNGAREVCTRYRAAPSSAAAKVADGEQPG